jgi:DNA-binding beta-propeller fold protein YncE
MKTPFNFSMRAACDSFGRMVCAGAVMLIASSAQAQNLFVADSNGTINEFTPGGVQSTFASLSIPFGLAFNSAGNLFVAGGAGDIYEFTPDGVQSTFASGLSGPQGLAFNSAGNLFVADLGGGGTINEFTPGGVRSTFASTFDSVGGALPGVSRLPGTRTFDKVDAGDGIGRAPRPSPPQAGRKVISIHRKSPRGMCSLSRIVRSRRVRRCVRR